MPAALPVRLAPVARAGLVALLGAAVLLAGTPARAGACGEGCSTVCEAGCDFASPRACANGAAAGSTCLVMGGTWHETVGLDADKFTEDLRFVCDDPHGDPCRVDGDGVRDHGFLGYRGWRIEGFEIFETKSHGISNAAGRVPISVTGCRIHDVGGKGINDIAQGGVIEGNEIRRAFLSGVTCTSTGALVQNNLVVDVALEAGAGIQCVTDGSLVLHNTVDVRSSPAATGGIAATTARYNVVLGGHVGLRAETASGENIVFAWTSTPWGVVAGGPSDLTGDPLVTNADDYHLIEGSPAVDLATTSLLAVDLDGDPRDAAPDAGCYEHDAADVAEPERWPFREIVGAPGSPASPAVFYTVESGLGAVFLDQDQGVVAASLRREDGAWVPHRIATGVTIPHASELDTFRRPLAVAADPTRDEVIVAWSEVVAGDVWRVRLARWNGDVCSQSDCASPLWSGCQDLPVYTGAGTASLDVAIDPSNGAPVVLVLDQETGQCGGTAIQTNVVVVRALGDGTWSTVAVAVGACGETIGAGASLSVAPVTGATEVVWTRAAGSQEGVLMHATDETGSWVVSEVPLEAGLATDRGGFTRVAARHRVDGLLGVAYTQRSPFGRDGFGYIERDEGQWGGSAVVDVMGPTGIRPMQGLELSFDGFGRPQLAYARNHVLRRAVRDFWGEDWDVEYVDVGRNTGEWATLLADVNGDAVIVYQDEDHGGYVRAIAKADYGGFVEGVPPGACDDGDPCTDSGCDALFGCVHPPKGCDDEDACTVDACELGVCDHRPRACEDLDPCTDDACDTALGCTHAFNTAPCDDGDPDTILDRCDEGACAGVPAVVDLGVIFEPVAVIDATGAFGPAWVEVAELVGVGDAVFAPVWIQVAESVGIDDVVAVYAPVRIDVAEDVGVDDGVGVVPGPAILIAEAVGVADTVAVFAPLWIQLAEPVGVDDTVAVYVPVRIDVAEGVGVDDGVSVVPGPAILIAEAVGVADTVAVFTPLWIQVAESVGVDDVMAVYLPARIDVAEDVGVGDDVGVVPGPAILIAEAVGVADTVAVFTPLWIQVAESVGVDDVVAVYLPARIDVAEDVGVDDGVGVVPGPTILITEAVGVADTVAIYVPVRVDLSESVGVVDAVAVLAPVHLAVSEVVGVDDAVAQHLGVHIAISEGVAVDDVASVRQAIRIELTEAVGVSDVARATPGDAPPRPHPPDCAGGGAPGGVPVVVYLAAVLALLLARRRRTPGVQRVTRRGAAGRRRRLERTSSLNHAIMRPANQALRSATPPAT